MEDLKTLAAHALHSLFILNKDVALPQDEQKRTIPKGTTCRVGQVILAPSEIFYEPFDVWVAVIFNRDDTDHDHYHEWTFPLDFLVDDCETYNLN